MKIKIKTANLKDYATGEPFNGLADVNKNEILVAKGLSKIERLRTIEHEKEHFRQYERHKKMCKRFGVSKDKCDDMWYPSESQAENAETKVHLKRVRKKVLSKQPKKKTTSKIKGGYLLNFFSK